MGGALLALVFVLPSLTKSEPKPAPTPTSTLVSHETADASVLLNSYIRSLAASNYQGAYSLLSDEVREKLTLQQYEEKMRAFFAQENNTVQFANAGITSKSSSSETRKIYSLQPPRRDLGPWECVMVRADGVWYISRIEGGPSVP